MAWVIFKPDDRLVEEGVPDEATAIARVALLGGTTTSIEVDDEKGGSDLPDWFFIGCYVDESGVLSEAALLTELEERKTESRLNHAQYEEWSVGLSDPTAEVSQALREKVHTWIYEVHVGTNRIMRSTHVDMTHGVKVAWLRATRLGASNVDSITAWWEQANPLAAPAAGGVVLANPITAARYELEGALTNSILPVVTDYFATAPTIAELLEGDWIDALV